ncbi:CBS domain-containing protein [Halobacteriales archaeon QH_8_64_26]|jgi:CBS domain-containing protein|nr:MAG: CBS domain-containing protein [Halobacteriales archaeon QH_8_64_26]
MSSREIPVSEIMTSPIRTVAADYTIAQAAGELVDHHIGSLLVAAERENGKRVEGILTETDVVASVAAGINPETTIGDVMSSPVVTVRPTESVSTAGRRMAKNSVKKLPVTEDGDPIGVVTTTDLAHFTTES